MCVKVKKNYEALRQREEEEKMVQSSPPRGGEDRPAVSKWEKESHEATRELLKVKDRLIEVERNVSSYYIGRNHSAYLKKKKKMNNSCVFVMLVFFPECYPTG